MLDPFPQTYDLIVCMEALSRVSPETAKLAANNLCQHSVDVLFSPLAPGHRETSPWSVKPPEYWAGLFAEQAFFRDVDFDASFVGAWGMRFRKAHGPLARVVVSYERRMWRLARESQLRREYGIEQHNELVAKEREAHALRGSPRQRDRELRAQLEDATMRLAAVSRQLEEVLGSRSWRLMRRVQQVRLWAVPLKSRRERWLRGVFYAVRVWEQTGFRELIRRAWRKTLRKTRVSVRRAWGWVVGRRWSPGVVTIWDVEPLLPLGRRTILVDLVVCVHDALVDVKRCLESIVRYTAPPYLLILVDDGSRPETRDMLSAFARSQDATLLRNEEARGYTRAANQGLRRSTADYVVLLNSDTVVTPRWLDRLVACAESDSRIGIVGPLSNAASWQSIPEPLTPTGELAENALPAGMTAAAMAEMAVKYSGRVYPRLPFLNGFCLLLRRKMIEELGYFDEETFGDGYGEENDYCLRAGKAGWQLAAADDAYVFHAQSRSYSHERRRELSQRSDTTLIEKHGSLLVNEGVLICRSGRVIQGVRARCQVMETREKVIEVGRGRWEGKRVLFLLPVREPGGGGHVVIQEAEAMRRMGVDTRLLNLATHRAVFERWYPDNSIPVEYIERPKDATEVLEKYDAAVGTVYNTMKWLEDTGSAPRLIRAYYIQDFEPVFFPRESSEYKEAWESYTASADLVRITKTSWNQNVLRAQIGVDSIVVGPSVAIDLFRPRRRRMGENGTLRVAAMVRPSTPRRGARLTMEVLRDLDRRYAGDVEVILFGCDPDDPGFHRLPTDFSWQHAGILSRARMAALLNEVDVFTDFSPYQAMGLTAMEAMACGAAVILPREGGAASFARHEENALVVDTGSRNECLAAVERLVRDEALRRRLGERGMRDVCLHPPEMAAYRLLEALFSERSSREMRPGMSPAFDLRPEIESWAVDTLRRHFEDLRHWNASALAEGSLSLGEASSRFAYLRSILPTSLFTGSARCLISGMSAGSELIVARREGLAEAHGVEIDPFYVEFCRRRFMHLTGFFPLLYDGASLPYKDESFNLVVSGHVIEHTENPRRYLTEHLRVLKRGGYLFLEFPTRYHRRELHTGLPSLEWLPRVLRNGLLSVLGARFSPLNQSVKSRVNTILATGLKQISLGGLRKSLASTRYDTEIVHSYKSTPGVVRCLVRRHV